MSNENWIRITLGWHKLAETFREILVAEMSFSGYQGFMEMQNSLTAWIPGSLFSQSRLEQLVKQYDTEGSVTISHEPEPNVNWNEHWERNYQPVWIGNQCQVRASFHPPAPGIPYDIVVTPGMAFGTGHHETTRLMMKMILDCDVHRKNVLDMGCGTGILSILACKTGAAEVIAIDNFPAACRIARENAERNNCSAIRVIEGDETKIPHKKFDIIMANITRNIIISMLPTFKNHLDEKGILLLSGFLKDDRDLLLAEAVQAGFSFKDAVTENQWLGLLLRPVH